MTTAPETGSDDLAGIQPGQILAGPMFAEPVRVETVSANGAGSLTVGVVEIRSERFRRVVLTPADIARIEIGASVPTYDGNGALLRLGIQAHLLGIAYEYDPWFALSTSRVDPLPHQLDAVYNHLLQCPSVRFLLADDAGAGKTIMAGLLIRELKLRGLIERILVVGPANLSFQWQRELHEKFDEQFVVLKGADIREQFGVNQWQQHPQVITSLDFAKREEILPGLTQADWDLVIVDEAHRLSAADRAHKSQRYRLGESLRDHSAHLLLLTATPHKGDPENFSLFLQLLDADAYADVKSIRQAMEGGAAPFYLRRTKEAMVYFPRRGDDGAWEAKKVFTKRIIRTISFEIAGEEYDLYESVTRFVKRHSRRAAALGDERRARAVGFLMSLYQRRLASSIHAVRRSLENRAERLERGLAQARKQALDAPPTLPDLEDLEEMEDSERDRVVRLLEAVTLAGNPEEVREEIADLRVLAREAARVEDSGMEAKLRRLETLMREQGFFDAPEQRLLVFTEFKDTLHYLLQRLRDWGFRVGCIHGGIKPGSRDEPGTRLHAEQQFREGGIQVLVATEAAGEGINLQCCHLLFNYDIPWNPNRLEQRMGRIHRYGQVRDCLIFNFFAANTVEGKVRQRLLEKLQQIRDALDDDAVFNVVGEVLPATEIEGVLRDYYAGRLGEEDLEERVLRGVDESRFREICQAALEGLATRSLNLEMLTERRARMQEHRVVPERIARFLREAAEAAEMSLRPAPRLPFTYEGVRPPRALKRYEADADWKIAGLAARYPRLSTDRETAEKRNLEWVTPGHPLFEALRRHALSAAGEAFTRGACFHSVAHDAPARLDTYRARVVDGRGRVLQERLFAVELADGAEPRWRDPDLLGDLTPAAPPPNLPAVAAAPEPLEWLQTRALAATAEARRERIAQVERVAAHVEVSLTEVLVRADQEIGNAHEAREEGVAGAEGRLARAENRHAEIEARRDRRREEFARERTLTLQGMERLASALILPHPDRATPALRNLRPNPETELTAMRVVMEHERGQGREVEDVSAENLGYDLRSLDRESGDLRLIEVKGFAADAGGRIAWTPNERRMAQDRPDCYWLYVVTGCAGAPTLRPPVRDPARLDWKEVSQVAHYALEVASLDAALSGGEPGSR